MAIPELNLKEHGPKILIFLAVLTALAIIITLIIGLISSGGSETVTAEGEETSEFTSEYAQAFENIAQTNEELSLGLGDETQQESIQGFLKDDPLFIYNEISPEDVFLPPMETLFKFGRYEFFRDLRQQWTWEDIKHFWHDPRILSAELLEETNDALIESLLQEQE
jgi:hypothetical protein